MKRGTLILLVLLSSVILSACDDFTRNVDGVIYDTYCYNKSDENYYTLVRLPEELQDTDLVEKEEVIGVYEDKEYFFRSTTLYNNYLVEITGDKGVYYPILEAIEKDDYVLEFIVDWCAEVWTNDENTDLSSR